MSCLLIINEPPPLPPQRIQVLSPRSRVLQFASDGRMKWGFDYDKSEKRFEWFKLEQDPKYTKDLVDSGGMST